MATIQNNKFHLDSVPGWGDHKKKSAFTMGELLIAVVVVGVVAGLVLPSVITHFQNKNMEVAQRRMEDTLHNAINGLTVSEHADDIRHTMLYTEEESPADYNDTSMAFMKKYLKMSKVCDSTNVSSECFAPTYYKYEDGKKVPTTPDYEKFKGACGVTKNGMALCMKPASKEMLDIEVLLDLNGRRGPNVLGRDLVEVKSTPETRALREANIKLAQMNLVEPEVIPLSPMTCDYENSSTWQTCCENTDTFNASYCCSLADYASDSRCNPCSDYNNGSMSCCLSDDGYFNAKKQSCCSAYGLGDLNSKCCELYPLAAYCTPGTDNSNSGEGQPAGQLWLDDMEPEGTDLTPTYNGSILLYYGDTVQLKKKNLKYAYRYTLKFGRDYPKITTGFATSDYMVQQCPYPQSYVRYDISCGSIPNCSDGEPDTGPVCCSASYQGNITTVWTVGLNDGSEMGGAPYDIKYPCKGALNNMYFDITATLEQSKDGVNWTVLKTCEGASFSSCAVLSHYVED